MSRLTLKSLRRAGLVLVAALAFPAAAREVWPKMELEPEWERLTDAARAEYCKIGYDYRPRLASHEKYDSFGDYMGYSHLYKWRANHKIKFDEDGVPQLLVKTKLYYNPLTIMQFVLTKYSQMAVKGEKTPPPELTAAIDQLMRMQSKDTGGFHYQFPKVYYVTKKEMPVGWVSGMTQGVSLSTFARLYHLTKDRRYIEAGNRALDFMLIPTTEGGTLSDLRYLHPSLSSYVTFEEYIAHPSTYTLNGFIYSTVGLYDWSKLPETGKHRAIAEKYYKESVRTIERILPYYDVGGFTAYDMAHVTHNRAPHFGLSYHRNHIELLTLLHTITGRRSFLDYARTWARYADEACPAGTAPGTPAAKPLAAKPPAPPPAAPAGSTGAAAARSAPVAVRPAPSAPPTGVSAPLPYLEKLLSAAPPATTDAEGRARRWESVLNTAEATGKLAYITDLDAEVTSAARSLATQPHADAVLLAGSMLRYLARATELGAPIAPQARDAVRTAAEALYTRDRWVEESGWISSATPSSAEQARHARFLYWLHRNNGDIEPLRRSSLITRVWKTRGWNEITAADAPWMSLWAAEAYREGIVLERADLAALHEAATRAGGAAAAVARALFGDKPAAPASSSDPLVASILAARAVPVTGLPVPEYPFTPRAAAPDFARSGKYALNEHGVLVVRYGHQNQYDTVGTQYNATFIAHYAHALHRDYLKDGDPAHRERFFRNVDWLLAHHDTKTWRGLEYWVWSFDFDNEHFAAKAPWFSGLAQGRILVALAQAYELSGDIEYYRAAERTLRSFYVPADAGGITTLGRDHAWYEEVAAAGTKSSKILNGHISAVAGLWSYMEWLGRSDVRRLFDLGVNAVLRDLPHYDAGFLSYYSDEQHKVRTFAPVRNYNSLHVHQLLWLHSVCDQGRFLDYAFRFARYDDPGHTFTVAGSTNETTNGPDKLRMTMGRDFWSHNRFPTWVQVDLGSVQQLDGVTLLGYIPKAAPRQFDILVSDDAEKWEKVAEQKFNAEQYVTSRFPKKAARFVRAVIYSDNGNNNVALSGVGVHLPDGGSPTAVLDWNSYGTSSRPATLFVTSTGWAMKKPGTLFIDQVKPQPLTLAFSGEHLNELAGYGSNDLQEWEPVRVTTSGTSGDYRYSIGSARHRYLKFDYPNLASRGMFRAVAPAEGIANGGAEPAAREAAAKEPAAPARTAPFPLYPFTPERTPSEYATEGRMDLDPDGIVIFDYGRADDVGAAGRRYNPTFIATYAIVAYRDIRTGGNASQRTGMLKNVDWLLAHREEAVHDGMPFWLWSFDFDYPYFGAKAPWYSGLAQSRIVVAFAQAYSLTGDPKYSQAAEMAFRAFLVPMRDGGLVTYDRDVVWLEEIAGRDIPSTKILNGHISALAALHLYAEWTGRADAARLARMATEAVRRDLPLYDASFLSWYAQEPGPERKFAPTANYNALHIRQLKWMYENTGDPFFLDYALRFGRYEEPGLTYSAAGSTDPVGHGPEGLRFRLGQEYWSHGVFPTHVQLDLGESRRVRSIVALARTPKSTPRHYEVLLSEDAKNWQRAVERKENAAPTIIETLKTPMHARYVRLLIHSDNGNRNVALTGFTAITDDAPVAVADLRVTGGQPPIREWCLAEPGYLVVDLGAPRRLVVQTPDGGSGGVSVSGSNDLAIFEPMGTIVETRRAVIGQSRFRYLRIDFLDIPSARTVRLK
ncbi:MAG TPA: D-glucuronyl C5-epimerase family protein [Thermoanaerobaculia bacterium]|nr:D-glucuronyl C5-epimerase family protein [Thermoanaerobaculia bacterium]